MEGPDLSALWVRIRGQFTGTEFDDDFFDGFRSPERPEFGKFASWSPLEPTYRYFKGFLFNLVKDEPATFFDNYRSIGVTELGHPLTVVVKQVPVNLEYVTSLEEFDFLKESIDLSSLAEVVEIGTGYGRTAHAFLRLMPHIKRYYAIDLPETWALGSAYLERVAPDLLEKIVFLDYRNPEAWADLAPDLTLNVDGFHAMTRSTLDSYKASILSRSRFVYIKNSVCKYDPKVIGLKTEVPKDLFENGYMTEIADIFNEDELNVLRPIYAQRYLPSSSYDVIAERPSESFGFFQHVLYERRT